MLNNFSDYVRLKSCFFSYPWHESYELICLVDISSFLKKGTFKRTLNFGTFFLPFLKTSKITWYILLT